VTLKLEVLFAMIALETFIGYTACGLQGCSKSQTPNAPIQRFKTSQTREK
jgi:hypothetical protein